MGIFSIFSKERKESLDRGLERTRENLVRFFPGIVFSRYFDSINQLIDPLPLVRFDNLRLFTIPVAVRNIPRNPENRLAAPGTPADHIVHFIKIITAAFAVDVDAWVPGPYRRCRR